MNMQIIEYTDSDGDELEIQHDPEGDPVEDLWVAIRSDKYTVVVRVPLSLLRDSLNKFLAITSDQV